MVPLLLAIELGCGRFGFEQLSAAEGSELEGGYSSHSTSGSPLPAGSATGSECRLGSEDHCSACGDSCAEHSAQLANASLACVSGACTLSSCASDYGDCDGEPDNGCEAALTSVAHCGACDRVCAFANADAACVEGSCVMDECKPGYGDCDGEPSNGCEVRVTTNSNCGGCGDVCAHDNAESSCNTGSCQLVRCTDGYDDCDGDAANGCETPLDSLDDCGACGVVCDVPGTNSESCSGGVCSAASCSAPFADCDGDGLSCETNLTTLDDCGLCGSSCGDIEGRLDHATATCSAGACAVGECDPGWANCDSSALTGCETPTNTNTDCGGCDIACSLSHAQASCSTGSCQVVSCDTGWEDCDASPGCETDLSSNSHCGGCDQACGASESCEAGECVPQFSAYAPSNFDPDSLPRASAPEAVLDCGVITLDTTTLTVSDWCGAPAPPIVARTQATGPELAVVTLRSLSIAAGTTLSVVGSRPVVFAVFGDVSIAGSIDASAQSWSGGPGENWQCLNSDGTNGTGTSTFGGGGGGGGGFRADGGDGGNGDLFNRGYGGVARGSDLLTPLVPGCRGGWGGGCGAGPGGGGGALQLSAAGRIDITGSLLANGGDGVDGCGSEGGGSGGGSGGAILVEANELVFSGSLLAAGGDGGHGANGGSGGLGSSSGAGADGTSHWANGGGGGGGSAGRVRLRAATSCAVTGTTAPSASTSCP